MGRNDTTSAMVDGLLRFLVAGGLLSTAAIAPNAVQLWNKPVQTLFRKLDKRSQEREYRRLIGYMKQRGLVKLNSEQFEHGLLITAAGRKRAEATNIHTLAIPVPATWDGSWHITLFDIPEQHKVARNHLNRLLRNLGCQPLQRSVWVHPFDYRQQLEAVSLELKLQKYITYMETHYIDAADKLIKRFPVLKAIPKK